MSSPARNLRVALRCDADHRAGVGHGVRLLALAEELQHRGAQVVQVGRLDVPWLRDAYAAHGIDQIDAPEDPAALSALARRLDVHAVVLDGYDLDPATGAALRAAGRTVLAMVDGGFGAAQEADLYVDQNLGARPRDQLPLGAIALAGIDYALFRDSVLERRIPPADRGATPSAGQVGPGAVLSSARDERVSKGRIEPRVDAGGLDTARPGGLAYSTHETGHAHSTHETGHAHSTHETGGDPATPDDADPNAPLKVLAVFGGTDPFGAAPVLTPLLLDTGLPLELTVVAPDPDVRARLETLPRGDGQSLRVVGPLTDLPGTAARSDLAISASGSSVWELLCLGVPTAVVCVADNQEPGYRETVSRGVVAGLGRLEALRTNGAGATRELQQLGSDPERRAALAARGRQLVDGGGRRRVADALERVRGT